jgi:hypothetical protein
MYSLYSSFISIDCRRGYRRNVFTNTWVGIPKKKNNYQVNCTVSIVLLSSDHQLVQVAEMGLSYLS